MKKKQKRRFPVSKVAIRVPVFAGLTTNTLFSYGAESLGG